MTKEGCPVAQPRLTNLPEARTITPWPSGKTHLSTVSLIFSFLIPG